MTVATLTFQLEHFYYGQLVKNGQPDPQMRALASTRGIKHEDIATAVKGALIPPLPGSADGAWALLRNRAGGNFLLVQAQLGAATQSMLHYVLFPPDALRAMSGNLAALMGLLEAKMPVYEMLGEALEPLKVTSADSPEDAGQIDAILDLMTYTKNNLEIVETLLAAIVQAVQIVVLHAPRDLKTRARLIEGLLALLPPSTRFGVTFATHSVTSTTIDAQIRFFEGDTPPGGTLVFEWNTGKLYGSAPGDDYARYIISQLRLDPELVAERTRALTSIAAWRVKRGDRLAESLAYASRRLAVDNALLNNLPVEVADASEILSSDPTLSEELRVTYARHLLSLSLALDDMAAAEPVVVILRADPSLEAAALAQMTDAVKDGKAGLIYETLARWLANPLGPQASGWIDLTHRAALAHLNGLIKQDDVHTVGAFLRKLQDAAPGVNIGRVIPKVIELTLPLSGQDASITNQIFVMAVRHLDSEVLLKLLRSKTFITRLPKALLRAVPHLTGTDDSAAPEGVLAEAARAFPEDLRQIMLLRLAEIALNAGQDRLFDTPTLAGLVEAAGSEHSTRYHHQLKLIAQNVTRDNSLLLGLPNPGPRYLLQILLATGEYRLLAEAMIQQSRALYPGDKQADYAVMVQRLFAETPIPVTEVPTALKAIHDGGVRLLPLAMAHIGALEGSGWSPVLGEVAEEVSSMLLENRPMLEVIPDDALLSLLSYHTNRQDTVNAIRTASLIPMVAAKRGTAGISAMARMYKMLRWEDRVKVAGMELLRRFVRTTDDDTARKTIGFFGRELGKTVGSALEATYSMKRFMGSVDLLDYAGFVHLTAEFLQDIARAYEGRNTPSIGALQNDLDSMTGGLTDDDRRMIAREIIGLGKALVALGDQQKATRQRDMSKHIDLLLMGKAEPTCALDVYFIMGGYFAKGKRFSPKLEETLHPLGERSAPTVKHEATVVNGVLREATRALPPTVPITLTTESVRGEMESQWGELSLHQQRELVRDLAIDLQRIPQLVSEIYEKGDPKAMDDNAGRKWESGKQRPRNTLEMLRFVAGYFKAMAG